MTEQVQEIINNYPSANYGILPEKYINRIDLTLLTIQGSFSSVEYMYLYDIDNNLLSITNLIE